MVIEESAIPSTANPELVAVAPSNKPGDTLFGSVGYKTDERGVWRPAMLGQRQ